MSSIIKSNVFGFKFGSFCYQDAPYPIPWQVHLIKKKNGKDHGNLGCKNLFFLNVLLILGGTAIAGQWITDFGCLTAI